MVAPRLAPGAPQPRSCLAADKAIVRGLRPIECGCMPARVDGICLLHGRVQLGSARRFNTLRIKSPKLSCRNGFPGGIVCRTIRLLPDFTAVQC